jgi:hypothetical protein
MRKAIQNKRRGILTPGVVLFHDNAHPHTAARTSLLEHSDWELFDHPSYNSDLARSDYYLFSYLKNWLRSLCCNNELIGGVNMWLSSQAAVFFGIGIQKRIHHTSASIPAMNMLKSSLSIYAFLCI